MKAQKRSIAVVFAILLLPIFVIGEVLAGPAEDCTALLGSAKSGTINEAYVVPATGTLPEYCRVIGTLEPAINYELRLPTTTWNGKFLQSGCGGGCGYIPIAGNDDALARGYAIVANDTGHVGASLDFSFGYNNVKAEINWGFRAVHIVTLAAKHLIRDYYGRSPQFSYFRGCSTGGRQGLMEAQVFPEDYDGIVAGAPSNFFTGINGVQDAWSDTVNRDSLGQKILTVDEIPLIREAVYEACDGLDGLIDGIIDDPRRCNFDPESLMCPGGGTGADCLSAAQVDVLRKLYDAARNSLGKPLYPGGAVKGSEGEWPGGFIGTGSNLSVKGMLAQDGHRYMDFVKDPGPSWSLFDFNFDRDPRKFHQKAEIYNASEYNLESFMRLGGKLILYQGWMDIGVYPLGTIYYYEQVVKHMDKAKHMGKGKLHKVENWFRLFMFPGMGHCRGGVGPNVWDSLTAIENWVEHGTAPDRIIAFHLAGGVVDRTRPVCPYPKVARLKSPGLDIDKAENFDCVEPDYEIPPNDWDNIERWPWD
jgi:hypothetical protein